MQPAHRARRDRKSGYIWAETSRTQAAITPAKVASIQSDRAGTGVHHRLDAGAIPSGETERGTAHPTAVPGDRRRELDRRLGGPGARLATARHTMAIGRNEPIASAGHIDRDFAPGNGYPFDADVFSVASHAVRFVN